MVTMIEAIRGWFTSTRREAIYAAVAALAPVLVLTGRINETQIDPILTLTATVLQVLAAGLMLANMRATEAADWFQSTGRAVIYSLALAAAPAAQALGWLDADQASASLEALSLGLTALASIIAIVHITPSSNDST